MNLLNFNLSKTVIDEFYNYVNNTILHRTPILNEKESFTCYMDIHNFELLSSCLISSLINNSSSKLFNDIVNVADIYQQYKLIILSDTTPDLYKLDRIPIISDKLQFIDIGILFLIKGKYNYIPKDRLLVKCCYNKILQIRTTAPPHTKSIRLLTKDVLNIVPWWNSLNNMNIEDNPLNIMLKERIDRRAFVTMFIIILITTKFSKSPLTTIAKQILNIIEQRLNHLTKYP